MTIQRSHGRVYPLVARPDELPAGTPGPTRRAASGKRGADGRLAPGSETSALAAAGGRAKAERMRLERLLGRVELPPEHPVAGYLQDSRTWRDAELQRLASTVGGGEVGPAAAGIVSSAALQHAASRALFDLALQTRNTKLLLVASRLADSARQNLLAAHELAAREAMARPASNPLAAFKARLAAVKEST